MVTEGERVEVTCTVDLSGVPASAVQVELFYVLGEQNEHRIVPMQPKDPQRPRAFSRCSFEITGRGQLSMNARVRPASPILQDLYPDLVKWAQ